MNYNGSYGDKQTTWGAVLLLKTRELAHYFVGKTKDLEFVSPKFVVQRVDSQEIRQKILKILYSYWKN
jgi:CRISPR-associated protein Cas1